MIIQIPGDGTFKDCQKCMFVYPCCDYDCWKKGGHPFYFIEIPDIYWEPES